MTLQLDERFECVQLRLNKPLLIINAPNGLLGCGYVNGEACNKTGDACAVVTGVSSFQDMLTAPVQFCSDAAGQLGITPGMSGGDALQRML